MCNSYIYIHTHAHQQCPCGKNRFGPVTGIQYTIYHQPTCCKKGNNQVHVFSSTNQCANLGHLKLKPHSHIVIL